MRDNHKFCQFRLFAYVCMCCVVACVVIIWSYRILDSHLYITDDYHSIQFKKSSDEVFKRAQELIHTGVSRMAHSLTRTTNITICTYRIFLYFSVKQRARRAQDSYQGLPNRSPPSWTAWLPDNKPHCASIRT